MFFYNELSFFQLFIGAVILDYGVNLCSGSVME